MGDKLRGLCSRIMKDPDLAEDAYWFTIYHIWEKCKQFKFQSKFESWCYRVTSNCCLMKLRSMSKSPTEGLRDEMSDWELKHFFENLPSTTDIVGEYQYTELAGHIHEARIRSFYKNTLLLRATGHTNLDASRVLGCSIPAVKSRFHRARQELSKQLTWLGYETGYRLAANA